ARGCGVAAAPLDDLPALPLHALHVGVDRGARRAALLAVAEAVGAVLPHLTDRLELRERGQRHAGAGATAGAQHEGAHEPRSGDVPGVPHASRYRLWAAHSTRGRAQIP